MTYKSNTIALSHKKLTGLTPLQVEFVDEVYHLAEQNYSAGGDIVVECLSPEEVLANFGTLNAVREYCGLEVEMALNTRWGEDTDPELAAAQRFDEGW